MAELDPLAELILPRLTQVLETALDITTSDDAMDQLEQIAELCAHARALASAGAVLQRRD